MKVRGWITTVNRIYSVANIFFFKSPTPSAPACAGPICYAGARESRRCGSACADSGTGGLYADCAEVLLSAFDPEVVHDMVDASC